MLEKVTAARPQITGNKTENAFKQQRPIRLFLVLQRPQSQSEDQMKPVDLVH